MSYQTDIARVIRVAETQGFRVSRTTRGHYQFYAPNRHDIITTSGTPGDPRGWHNFLADMRRAGFQEAVTSFGDAMAESTPPSPEPAVEAPPALPPPVPTPTEESAMPKKKRMTYNIPDRLRTAFQHRATLTTAEAIAIARSAGGSAQAAYSALNMMTKKGEILRSGKGIYRRKGEPVPVVAEKAAKAKTHAANESSGDPKIDADLHALDEALAALARIEGIVRRHREVLHSVAELKKLMGQIGS